MTKWKGTKNIKPKIQKVNFLLYKLLEHNLQPISLLDVAMKLIKGWLLISWKNLKTKSP